MIVKLPETLRPRGVRYRAFSPGLDLPSWFYDGLKSIDPHLYLVYHPYKVTWDDIINQYEGPLDDPRFTIHYEYGELNWGWVLTDGNGNPIPENTFHVWRLCRPHGWAHVVGVEASYDNYLRLLLNRLDMQARWTEKHGSKSWNRKLDEDQEALQEKLQQEKQALFDDVQKENEWLIKKAAENFARGHYAPTRPTKEQIISYAGQQYRSRVERELTDEEGGLILPKGA